MNIDEASDLLEKNGITNSKQMLRRWIRQGKIEATLLSKKQGYQIDEKSLDQFINEKKNDVQRSGSYQEGFSAGYAAAKEEISDRFRKMMLLGMYEKQFPIRRGEFREHCSDRISERNLRSFLEFSDKTFFSKGVSNPRQKIYCNQIGDYFYFENTGLTIDRLQFNCDQEISLEDNALDMLIQVLLEDFRNR
ncbi:MAG: helix-turn-helix domain-containing protein [Enterococcus hulanensis]